MLAVWILRAVTAVLFRLRVEGRVPAEGPLLIAANHVSYLDPVTLGVTIARHGRRGRFLATAALFGVPVLGWAMRRTGLIRVEPRAGRAVLDMARAALEAGEVVVLYPEGHIAAPGQDLPARTGVGWLARQTGVPVVPVAQWGMQRENRRLGWLRRRHAAVVVGVPLYPSGGDDRAAAAEVLDAVRALLPWARASAHGHRRP